MSNVSPLYEKCFGDHWIQWFLRSNTYSVIDSHFKGLLDDYFKSSDGDSFKTAIALEDSTANAQTILETLTNYLENCNRVEPTIETPSFTIETSKRAISKTYVLGEKCISVFYDSDDTLNLLHPSIAYLSDSKDSIPDVVFDVYTDQNKLCLYKNKNLLTSVPERDIHLVQGKFIMHLVSAIHEKTETDWIGTLHGSTLTDGKNSILFIGKSGKGKSTLCALLSTQGFKLLADDMSPLAAKNSTIYYNPLAVSVKSGAFKVLEPLVPHFKDLPISNFKTSKGPIKYIPCKRPEKDHYPCKAIVLVNYQAGAETNLKVVSIKSILETLIPDSWLSPKPEHAKRFLDWLASLRLYELTYSDTAHVTEAVSQLFKTLHKD